MTYRIKGLDPAPFAPLFELDDEALAKKGITRMTVAEKHRAPCRIMLDDVEPGDSVLLLNHVSHDAPNAYKASHAIFVSQAVEAAEYRDSIPPALDRRILSLRAFDDAGVMVDAALAQPGEADPVLRSLFANNNVAYIHAHNAIRGCFAAKVERA